MQPAQEAGFFLACPLRLILKEQAMATLHLLCGKIAAGKSTLAGKLAAAPGTAALSEDHWIARLYPGEVETMSDYLQRAARLRGLMAPHIENLLRAGVSVVLDYPANTPASREWMRGIFVRAGADHRLHYLDVSDEICLARLRDRNARDAHDYFASEAEYHAITSQFVPPGEAEGFNVVVYRTA
jgi:predicted kinase